MVRPVETGARMGLSFEQKMWMDENWHLFGIDKPWREVDTKGSYGKILREAKKQAVTAVPSESRPRAKRSRPSNPNPSATVEECVICLQKERTHCYIPCGHICLCAGCVTHPLIMSQCPVCKQPGEPQRIYHA